jgi:hypothetical protein
VIRALLALGVCVALALGGCGGSDDSASTTSSASEATTSASATRPSPQSTTPTARGEEKSKQTNTPSTSKGDSQKQGNGGSKPNPQRVKAPAISSAPIAGSKSPAPGVKTVPGGDNSVQEYGVEADESSRREAAIALQAYLNARAEEDWGTACSYLAQRPTAQLEKLAGNKASCAEVLEETGKGVQSQPGSAITEVLSLRGEGDISGDPSYLIFKGPPGGTLFSMPMYLEGGAWKVGLARAAELPVG